MLRAFEHQMLEEVRKPGAAGSFVLRSDVVPDVDRNHRQLVMFVDDDVETVGRACAWCTVFPSMTGARRPDPIVNAGNPHTRWRMLAALAVAEFLGMTLWFSATAVTPTLVAEFGMSRTHASWLTIAVQAGFVVGTLASAVANLADVLNARVVFLLGTIVGGGPTPPSC